MKDIDKSYIAGFLDGDGSIMAQLVFRKDYKLGYQIRVSIVFYQKTTHQEFLLWLKEQLEIGYIRRRPDGMSEYCLVGLAEVEFVLKLLGPYLHLKQELAHAVLRLIKNHPPQRKMTPEKLVELAMLVDETARFNYSKKRTRTSSDVIQFLQEKHLISPVST